MHWLFARRCSGKFSGQENCYVFKHHAGNSLTDWYSTNSWVGSELHVNKWATRLERQLGKCHRNSVTEPVLLQQRTPAVRGTQFEKHCPRRFNVWFGIIWWFTINVLFRVRSCHISIKLAPLSQRSKPWSSTWYGLFYLLCILCSLLFCDNVIFCVSFSSVYCTVHCSCIVLCLLVM
jgi:hypothetical protein